MVEGPAAAMAVVPNIEDHTIMGVGGGENED